MRCPAVAAIIRVSSLSAEVFLATDHSSFWSAISTLANAFREEDPVITGKVKAFVEHFDALPEDRQVQLRLDVQLLQVHLAKLALGMTISQAAPPDTP